MPRFGVTFDMGLSSRVLAALNDGPKTIAELQDAVRGDPLRVRFAVYNLVKRGRMQNLNAGSPHGTSGLFSLIGGPAEPLEPGPRCDATALEHVWFGRG